ncbi:MAG TPA: hypothetical protein VIM99_10865 [Blastocatellia bacterium]
MTENALASSASSSDETHLLQPRAFDAILYGGLVVGVLDGSAAVITTLLYGNSPARMFQSIARGLLGRASYEGGWTTVLLGVALHFLIAFIWATIYNGASFRFPALIRRALICGPIYGVAVFFAMQTIVLPLSAIRSSPFAFTASLKGMSIGIGVHIICVGLPIALMARQAAEKRWKTAHR